jgi:hypothetical protein
MNNEIVCDLNKCQWASLVWKNQWGDYRKKKPKGVTVHNCPVTEAEVVWNSGGKLMIDLAKENGLIDVWVPVLRLQFSANNRLSYYGSKALSIYKEWCRRVFKPRKEK